MAKLIYAAITSLDGFIADADGKFDWGEPDEEVHSFINDLQRSIGTYLYGRRLYEVMVAWETMSSPDAPRYIEDYAEIWRAADKVVYSRTLEAASTARTRIESEFVPEAIAAMKTSAYRDLSVGGAHLAADAFAAGVIDECHLFLAPVAVGGGTPALPDNVRLDLELVGERSFDSGFVYLYYRVVGHS